jgi:hypothetical protein
MLLNKTGRPVMAALGTAVLAGLLPLGGCTDSTPGSTAQGSGDKRNDPALKSSMEKSKDIFKPQTGAPNGKPGAKSGR